MGEQVRAETSSAVRLDQDTVKTSVVSAPRQTATVHQIPRTGRPNGRVRRGMVRYALALADLAGLVTALAGAYFLTSGGTTLDPLLIVLPAWAILSGFYGLYRRDRVGADNATLDEVWPIFHCVTVASWTVFAIVQVLSPTARGSGRRGSRQMRPPRRRSPGRREARSATAPGQSRRPSTTRR